MQSPGGLLVVTFSVLLVVSFSVLLVGTFSVITASSRVVSASCLRKVECKGNLKHNQTPTWLVVQANRGNANWSCAQTLKHAGAFEAPNTSRPSAFLFPFCIHCSAPWFTSYIMIHKGSNIAYLNPKHLNVFLMLVAVPTVAVPKMGFMAPVLLVGSWYTHTHTHTHIYIYIYIYKWER